MRGILRILVAVVVVGCGAGAARATDPLAFPGLNVPEKPRRVAALLVADTEDKAIGAGAAANLRTMERLVRGLPGFEPNTDLIVLTRSKDLTEEKILAAIEKLNPRKWETFFFYAACHGAYDPDLTHLGEPTDGLALQLPGGLITRERIRATVEGDSYREGLGGTAVLLTDTCNVYSKAVARDDRGQARSELAAAANDDPIRSPVFAHLLQRAATNIDVSGSGKDQYGWYLPTGGLFTRGLVDALADFDRQAEGLQKRFGGWTGLTKKVWVRPRSLNPLEDHLLTDDEYAAKWFKLELPAKDTPPAEGSYEQVVAADEADLFAQVSWTDFLTAATENTSRAYKGLRTLVLKGPKPTDPDVLATYERISKQEDQRPKTFCGAYDRYWFPEKGYQTEAGERFEFQDGGLFVLHTKDGAKRSADMKGGRWRAYGRKVLVVELDGGRWYRLAFDEQGLKGTSKEKSDMKDADAPPVRWTPAK